MIVRGPDVDIATAVGRHADVVMCRDVLAHLPNALAEATIAQARRAAPIFLATSFQRTQRNVDIRAPGDFRPLNLQLRPFNLPAPDAVLPDSDGKSMCLWRWR